MTTRVYPVGGRLITRDGTLDFVATRTVRALLLDSGYTFSAAHATMETANFPAANIIAESPDITLASANGTSPFFDVITGTPVSISGAPVGDTVNSVVYFVVGASLALSIPLLYADGANIGSLTTDGNLITFTPGSPLFGHRDPNA
jgi:hypothetical protein